MKAKKQLTMAIALAVSVGAWAQAGIEREFQRIKEMKGIQTSVTSNRDEVDGVGVKTQIIDLKVGKPNFDIFKKLQEAFEHESDKAYSEYVSIDPFNGGASRQVWSISKAQGGDIFVGSENNSSVLLSCFNDPNHPDYRHVYAAEWWDTKDKDIRQGRLIYSYGKKPKPQTRLSRSFISSDGIAFDLDSLFSNVKWEQMDFDSIMQNFPKEKLEKYKEQLEKYKGLGQYFGTVTYDGEPAKIPLNASVDKWMQQAYERIQNLNASDWNRFFGLMTENLSSNLQDMENKDIIVASNIVAELCKNVPPQVEEEERLISISRLVEVAKAVKARSQYAADILSLASDKLSH